MTFTRALLGFGLVCLLALTPLAAQDSLASDGIDDATRSKLINALNAELNKLTDHKNADGQKDKRANYARVFTKQDDGTYLGSAQVNTAGLDSVTTERYRIVLAPKGDGFEVTSSEVVDTYVGMGRDNGGTCYNFDKIEFYREGLTVSGTNGGVCEGYYLGEVTGFTVMAPDLAYDYQIPEHVGILQSGHDFYALRDIISEEHADVFVFEPNRLTLQCDPATCEELLDGSFTGIERVPKEQRTKEYAGLDTIYAPLRERVEKYLKELQDNRRENPFSGFRRGAEVGNKFFIASVRKNDDHAVGIRYDNWEGYEVVFWANHRLMDPEAPRGALFGYYTEETLKTTDFYELERRDDQDARWYDAYKVHADAVAGVDDPEMVSATVEYGLNIKHDLDVLPFFIATTTDNTDENYKRATLFVNSMRIDGEELTWVKTSSYGGFAVLPKVAKAGSKLEITVSFDTQAIRKYNTAYSQLARFGWLPFVRFGDFVEDFEMTLRTPAEYKVLGVGHQVDERKEGDVLITHWKADNPVVFPSVIFGKYTSDKPSFAAKKLDGTEIPVEVHVDEVSMMIDTYKGARRTGDTSDRKETGAVKVIEGTVGIRGKQLRSIAEQAANAINLYGSLSGVDYPYGSLNLVNDPVLALYGQAPSSLIYLGSNVFRGEGEMSGEGSLFGGGGTGTSKFLKSVVAHEVGHQWWGSRVSNSNQRNYWFVETLAEYFSALYLEAVYGRKEYDEQVEEWRRNVLNNNLKASVQAADSLWPGESGGRARQSLIYNKGPYAFHVLRETFGDEKFFPFLKAFTQELSAKQEIVTRDIQMAAEKNLGGVDENGNHYNVDLEWFFDQWIRGVGLPEFTLDYTIRPTEDGAYLIEGTVTQAIMIGYGKSARKVDGKFYRGVIDLTVTGKKKGEEFQKKLVINGESTEFRVKVPVKPVEVAINKGGGMLSRDVIDATVARN
jgi:hypothetical protein